jgi:cation:H+ antiporter
MDISFSLSTSILIFCVSTGFIWYFCTKLSDIVDFIDSKFNLGSAFGGTIILAVVTNLPEIAIIMSGSLKGDVSLAVGNILGGITVQSVILVLFDFASRKERKPLSTLTGSETSILQGLFLVAVLTVVIIGKQFQSSFIFARTTPPELMIFFVWIASIFAMKRFQKNSVSAPKQDKKVTSKLTKTSSIVWLVVVSLIVLIFGVLLETTSSTIAKYYEIDGVIFGATILALVTSLPEISGGLAFVRNKSYEPIISDIFGGNTFLPVLFLPATLITGKAILPGVENTDIYLTSNAILITLIYLVGMTIKEKKRYFGLGMDSWVVLIIYLVSVVGMFWL